MMKKVFLFALAAFFTSGLLAQPRSGDFILGGEFFLGFRKGKTKENVMTQDRDHTLLITALPRFGYLLSGRLALGVYGGVDYSRTRWDDETSYEDVEKTFSFGLFMRHYLNEGQGGVFLEETMGFGCYKPEAADYLPARRERNFSVGIAPGVYFYATERLALEAKIGWLGFESRHRYYDELEKDFIASEFGIRFSPQDISLGITIAIGRKPV